MFWIVLFCVVASIYWLWNHRNNKADEPPYLPGAWPILGHITYFIGDTCKLWKTANTFKDQLHSVGGVARFAMGLETMYVLGNPSDVVIVANACLDKASSYDFFKSWVGNGLFNSNGSTWKKHRKLLNPAFSQNMLDTFINAFNDQARNLVEALKKEVGKGYFDHFTYTKMTSIETACVTTIGANFGDTEEKKTYIKNVELLLRIVVERILRIWLHPPQIFQFSKLKKMQDDCKKIQKNIMNSIIQRKKSQVHENISAEENLTQGTKFKSYMDILLELSQQGVLNDREVRAHADTIVITGTDSSASTLAFILLLLGVNPDVQDKVVAELKEVFGDEDRDVEKTDLSKLIYLDAVIKESLRLYPIGILVARQITKDIKLENYTLYAGHKCGLFLYAVNTHACWGPDRHQFRPERWLDPTKLPEDRNAFASFSIGRRMCIGKTYATMFMKTVLAQLIRRYKVITKHSQIQVKVDTLLKPASGQLISIENRNRIE